MGAIQKIINKYFYFYIKNPLKTYWKVRKYFKFPKLICQFYKSPSNDAKILSIESYDIFWKDKWDAPSQERDPIFVITLFNKYHFQIDFRYYYNNSNYSMEYWESILWFVYYDKTLNQAVFEGTSWRKYNPKTTKYEFVEVQVLKDKYHKLYKKEYS